MPLLSVRHHQSVQCGFIRRPKMVYVNLGPLTLTVSVLQLLFKEEDLMAAKRLQGSLGCIIHVFNDFICRCVSYKTAKQGRQDAVTKSSSMIGTVTRMRLKLQQLLRWRCFCRHRWLNNGSGRSSGKIMSDSLIQDAHPDSSATPGPPTVGE